MPDLRIDSPYTCLEQNVIGGTTYSIFYKDEGIGSISFTGQQINPIPAIIKFMELLNIDYRDKNADKGGSVR